MYESIASVLISLVNKSSEVAASHTVCFLAVCVAVALLMFTGSVCWKIVKGDTKHNEQPAISATSPESASDE